MYSRSYCQQFLYVYVCARLWACNSRVYIYDFIYPQGCQITGKVLTQCGPMMLHFNYRVTSDSASGLLLDDTKPLPGSVATNKLIQVILTPYYLRLWIIHTKSSKHSAMFYTNNFIGDSDPDKCFFNQHSYSLLEACNYQTEQTFNNYVSQKGISNNNFSLFHLNIRSVPANLSSLLSDMENLDHRFSVIGLTETWLNPSNIDA